MKNLLVDFKRKHDANSLNDFKEYLKPENIIKNCVILRTIHSSKGTERPITFILDVNQRSIPMEKEENIFSVPNELKKFKFDESEVPSKKKDEEKRIFYVALTRAKNLMFILCTRKYESYRGKQNTIESEFLKKIDYQKNDDVDFSIIQKPY